MGWMSPVYIGEEGGKGIADMMRWMNMKRSLRRMTVRVS
jgi:hypothetical protein